MEAHEADVQAKVETKVDAQVETHVEECHSMEKAEVDTSACDCSDHDLDDSSAETLRAEVSAKRDMPKFQVVAKKGVQVLFWSFDGRRELDTALAENDYDEILKIYRGKEIPFKMKKGISLA